MQAGKSPIEDNWGAIVTYEPSGYVPDTDAASTDYTALLKQMQEAETDVNAQRKTAGYPTIHVVGWAESPAYDKASHAMVWARDIKFSDGGADMLNYDVRSLGRSGVLSVNMVSTVPHLSEVRPPRTSLPGMPRSIPARVTPISIPTSTSRPNTGSAGWSRLGQGC